MAQHSADFRMVNYCNSATYMASMNFELAYIWDGHRINSHSRGFTFPVLPQVCWTKCRTRFDKSRKITQIKSVQLSKWLRWWENPCKHCRTLEISNGYVSLPEGTMGLFDKLGWGLVGALHLSECMGQKNRTEENSGKSPFHPLLNKFPYIQKDYLEWRAPFSDTIAQKHMKTMKAPKQFIENPFAYRLMLFFPVYGFCRVHVNTVQVHSKQQDSKVSKLYLVSTQSSISA